MAGWKAGFMGVGLVGLGSLFGGCTLAPHQSSSHTRLMVVEPVHYHQPRPVPRPVTVVTMPTPIVTTSTQQQRPVKPASYGVQPAAQQRVQSPYTRHPQHPAHPLHPEHPAHPQHPLRPQNTVAAVKQPSRVAGKPYPHAGKPKQPGKSLVANAQVEKAKPHAGKTVGKPAPPRPAKKPGNIASNNKAAADHGVAHGKADKEKGGKNSQSGKNTKNGKPAADA